MKMYYEISSIETGTILIRRRKISKALRSWLRENGTSYSHRLYEA